MTKPTAQMVLNKHLSGVHIDNSNDAIIKAMEEHANNKAEEMAIGFAKWLDKLPTIEKFTVHPPAGSGGTHGLFYRTTEDLLRQYKQSLK